MSKKIWKAIEISILKQIYACKGGVEQSNLFILLEKRYGISEKIFSDILHKLVEHGDCIIEKIIKLNKEEIDVVFVTLKGVETLGEKEDISVKKVLSNKIAYELKCEGYASYAEWLDNNREKLILEENITGMYARALGDMGCVLLMENIEKIKESLEVAIEQLKGRMEKTLELCNVIDVSIVIAVYEKLLDLIGRDNFVEEVKKANKLFDSIMPDRHNAVDSFL